MDDTKEIIKILKNRFKNIREPQKEDICYATQNRQDAVKTLCQTCELVIVCGSPNSSNSNRLVETAKQLGVESLIIDLPEDFNMAMLEPYQRVGITSGASVPEYIVNRLAYRIKQQYPTVQCFQDDTVEKDIRFPLPKEVADMCHDAH